VAWSCALTFASAMAPTDPKSLARLPAAPYAVSLAREGSARDGFQSKAQRKSESQPTPSGSPGTGLGAILGNCVAADKPTLSVPGRTPSRTGSAYMTGEHDVKLHMYDLSNGVAKAFAPVLGNWWSSEECDGVWHSAVVVFGQEYYFNGCLVHDRPGGTLFGSPTKVVTIGHTSCGKKAFHQFVVEELRPKFNKSSYDALDNNCNHFTDHVCMFLCRRHIPDLVLHQPEKLLKLPALRLMRPFLDQWLGSGISEEDKFETDFENAPREADRNRESSPSPAQLHHRGSSRNSPSHRESSGPLLQIGPHASAEWSPRGAQSGVRAASPHSRGKGRAEFG